MRHVTIDDPLAAYVGDQGSEAVDFPENVQQHHSVQENGAFVAVILPEVQEDRLEGIIEAVGKSQSDAKDALAWLGEKVSATAFQHLTLYFGAVPGRSNMHAASMEHSDSPVFDHWGDAHSAGVSWGAVIGGAFVAAALSLIMLALGTGFGLSAISPWSNVRASAATVGAVAIIWLIVTEAVASSMGGYLAGRLRTRWHAVHNDEVHFRDTANGFLVWAVALVITVAFLAAAAASMVGSVPNSAEASMTINGAPQGSGVDGNAYFVDRLFRSDHAGPADKDIFVRAEAARIFAHALFSNEVSIADNGYLAQLVASKTGLNPSEAAKRVSETIADARQTEENARKATAHLLLWVFVALLIGAFCASYAATIGGRQRDHVKLV